MLEIATCSACGWEASSGNDISKRETLYCVACGGREFKTEVTPNPGHHLMKAGKE